jgi:hypothetical protein
VGGGDQWSASSAMNSKECTSKVRRESRVVQAACGQRKVASTHCAEVKVVVHNERHGEPLSHEVSSRFVSLDAHRKHRTHKL